MPDADNEKNPVCETREVVRTQRGQVLAPGPVHKFEIRHTHREAVQFDFYIPVAVYYHTATRHFVQRLGVLAPGATIFRGATGTWNKDGEKFEEDVYVYRLIIETGEFTPENLRMGIHAEIRALMAELGEWRESRQYQMLFTETVLCLNKADLVNKPKYKAKLTGKKTTKNS